MNENETYEQILKRFDEAILEAVKNDVLYAVIDTAYLQGWKEGHREGYELGHAEGSAE
jgi:hypothetical protein